MAADSHQALTLGQHSSGLQGFTRVTYFNAASDIMKEGVATLPVDGETEVQGGHRSCPG